MSHGVEPADPLARAIAEFRNEFLLWIDREVARAQGPEFLAEMGPQPPREAERFADRMAHAEISGAPVAGTGEETEPQPQDGPGNPRHRLDALARLLDHRLKQVEGAAEASRGPISRRSQETPDESLSHSDGRATEWTADWH
jgi:hypothetical protein